PGTPRLLPSFLTRRSSDLLRAGVLVHAVRLADHVHLRPEEVGAFVPADRGLQDRSGQAVVVERHPGDRLERGLGAAVGELDYPPDRKSTRLNSSHVKISYA